MFTAAGFILGADVLGILRIHIDGGGLRLLAELTLAIFGSLTPPTQISPSSNETLGPPERLLLIGLPLRLCSAFLSRQASSLGSKFLQMALLAAMFTPTDAALGKPVMTNPTVPAEREALNLESGLNDGICVPIGRAAAWIANWHQIEGGPWGMPSEVVIEARRLISGW